MISKRSINIDNGQVYNEATGEVILDFQIKRKAYRKDMPN